MTIANEQQLLSTISTTFPAVHRALVIAPHPDDEVFGCGGTMSLLQARGCVVTTLIVTNGALGSSAPGDGELIAERAAESCAAAKLLRLKEPIFWNMPDRGVNYDGLFIERLMGLMLETAAELIFLPAPTDWHPDHQTISLAGAEAIRRLGGGRQAAFYEVTDPLPNPNLIHNISSVDEIKRQAMRCFQSQLREQPYDTRISGINNFRALHLGAQVKSAEAFTLLAAADFDKGLSIILDGPLAYRRGFGFATSGGDLPLVSVIIRSMDRPTLTDALNSLALQTYPNIEVVLVNAKGLDHQEITQGCGRFPIRMIGTDSCLNRSLAANMGLDAALGEYLMFLDDDDWFDANHIQKLVAGIREHEGYKAVYTGVRCVDESKNPLPNKFDKPFDSVQIVAGNYIPIHAVLFSRGLLDLGCRLDESLVLYEDWDFWIQLSTHGDFLWIEGLSAVYRITQQTGFGVNADPAVSDLCGWRVRKKWLNQLSERQVKGIVHSILLNPINEEQISQLRQAVAERDVQISQLHQSIAEKNEKIAAYIAALNNMNNSTSWKVTKPIRLFRRLVDNPQHYIRQTLATVARWVWTSVPVSGRHKQLLKHWMFSHLPHLFSWSQAYRSWNSINMPDDWTQADGAASNYPEVNAPTISAYAPLLHAHPPRNLPVRLIAFYLPQFHAIPENNAWWGEGFTEWTNVQPAQPQFADHYQPHIPGELGYYNLLDPTVQRRQIELAKLYGVGGFCFYFYWFGGKLLLEKPLENYLKDASLDLPFCLCWANENWSRRWDGLENDILIAQKHSPEDDLGFIQHVAQYMRDERYIRIDGKPLLIVYRPNLLPSAKETVRRWRQWCNDTGIGEIFLAYTQSFEEVAPTKYGFDAAIEFPPNNSAPPNVTGSVSPQNERFATTVYEWRALVERSRHYRKPAYKLFRGVCPSWDNTARKKNKGIVFLNSTPQGYQKWLTNAIMETCKRVDESQERLVFVNAWNEWAEGAHLEPDQRYGYAYLEASRLAMVRSELMLREHIVTTPQAVAVVLHAFYDDVLEEILVSLEKITKLCLKLYVTTTAEKEHRVQALLDAQPNEYLLRVVENRGRDILPFMKILPDVMEAGHEFLVKIHTKKSLHRVDGDAWRKDLFDKLLDEAALLKSLELFQNDSHIGILGPDGHLVAMNYFWGSNSDRVSQLAARMGVGADELASLSFVAGSMFTARLDCMIPLMNLAIDDADFEPELGQIDGTLAHAIERLFSVSAHSICLKTSCPSKAVLTKYEFVKK